jgi:hypothetical protein
MSAITAVVVTAVAAFLGVFVFGPYQTLGLVRGELLLDNAPEKYAETRARAEAILDALAAYRRSRSEYPGALEELVPEFLPALLPPLVGRGRWDYERRDQSHFILRFFVGPTYESDAYDSERQDWRTDR